ncbi:hypothetical protein FE810_13595 [Thalassotalea litorea]|uniref:DUF3379 domain-containing protein n=1 Tax=Thalassotalea litorea TaxID=2020715 RepID=A0A5R9IKM5_9GAMM|nr:hypothetical protein [Thalassotalea litorea]TLU61847.1 hypothetical protein FE810_13595 [Thalassotalea litorea]
MHLNDQQLLSANPSHQDHLNQCLKCQRKAQQLRGFRSRLAALPELNLPQQKLHLVTPQQQCPKNRIKPGQLESSNTLFSRCNEVFGTLAVASVVIAVILFAPVSIAPINQKTDNLTQLIQQNFELQEALLAQQQNELSQINYQLLLLDSEIQNAYFQYQPVANIENLWMQRKKLIKQHLNKSHEANFVFRI